MTCKVSLLARNSVYQFTEAIINALSKAQAACFAAVTVKHPASYPLRWLNPVRKDVPQVALFCVIALRSLEWC